MCFVPVNFFKNFSFHSSLCAKPLKNYWKFRENYQNLPPKAEDLPSGYKIKSENLPRRKSFTCNTFLFFVWARSFLFGEACRITSFTLAPVASLQLDWALTTGGLLGPTICLPRIKMETFPFVSCLRTQRVYWVVLQNIPIVLSAQQGICEYHFLVFCYDSTRKINPGLPTAKRTL